MRLLPFLGLAALVLFSRCAAIYYPNAVNTPLFSEKGQAAATTSVQMQEVLTAQVQTAYAFKDNWAVQVNGSFLIPNRNSVNERHVFGEAAIGWFRAIDQDQPSAIFECFAGYGRGYTHSFGGWFSGSNWAEAFYHRLFIQPTVGHSGKIFDAAFSMRMGQLIVDKYRFAPRGNQDPWTSWGRAFVEPCFTARLGFKQLRWVTQFGLSLPLRRMDGDKAWQPLIFNTGIQVNLRSYKNY